MERLVVLEGLDGSGKSTQLKELHKYLKSKGEMVKTIKLPDYDNPSSTLVKMYLGGEFGNDPSIVNAYAASTFYAVDRYTSFNRKWKKEYEAGTWILADRYTTSNIPYQMTKLPKNEWEDYMDWLIDFEYGKLELPRPDLVIFLDMPVEVSQKLMTERYGGNESEKDIHESHVEYLLSCREAAMVASKRFGWNIINCSSEGKPLSIEEIGKEIIKVVEERFYKAVEK